MGVMRVRMMVNDSAIDGLEVNRNIYVGMRIVLESHLIDVYMVAGL